MTEISKLAEALNYNENRLQKIDLKPFGVKSSQFYIYLDHLNHDLLSGNKLRKLYGNILDMKAKNKNILLTIGGNYSNYLHACAFLPELADINLVAIVKGYEPKKYGFTLQTLKDKNADIHFHTKHDLAENLDSILEELYVKYPSSKFIPEGGNNELAHQGFDALIKNSFDWADKICVGVGTMASYHSIDKYKSKNTHLRGYAAMNDMSLLEKLTGKNELVFDYTFGGFAKMTDELKAFVGKFKHETNILLDPIYTSKMVFGIIEDYKKGILKPEEKIVAIHTGGLQGWEGI
jgi:1-aminocyclopropane-1-carboxylate deaminase